MIESENFESSSALAGPIVGLELSIQTARWQEDLRPRLQDCKGSDPQLRDEYEQFKCRFNELIESLPPEMRASFILGLTT